LALVDVVLQLQRDGVAADVADVAAGLVRLAAARAEYFPVAVRIGDERVAALAARLAQVLQPLELAALAFPVADRILDELERAVLPEVRNREHRLEHRLQAGVLALGRQTVHLQEALVGLLLDLDQVRDRNGRLDFRKIDALSINVLGKAVHSLTSRKDGAPAGAHTRTGGFESEPRVLLDLDFRADFLELLLDGRGLVLVHAFLDRLGRALDEVLGFLQTEAGDLADDLDHVDLVAADFGQRHREVRLLLGRGRRA